MFAWERIESGTTKSGAVLVVRNRLVLCYGCGAGCETLSYHVHSKFEGYRHDRDALEMEDGMHAS